MLKYIGKRILTMIPVLLGISFIIFMIMSLTPGDPANLILGEGATKEAVAELREEMGLNDPVLVQYVRYMFKVITKFDFGTSYLNSVPVMEELLYRLPTTIKLAIGSVALMVIIGVPVGILSAVKQYSIMDNATLLIAMVLCAMPSFFFGLLSQLIFSLKLGWLPAIGADTWKHFILPCATCCAVHLAQLIRMTRSNMLEVIRADYIRTARSKGCTERRIIFRHALRNALLPVITIIGLNFGAMLGGAIITESVFSLPGLGTMMINGIRKKDTPAVMASLLFVALMISIINLVVDLIYAAVDPKLRSTLK
jgi:peptide/nickel transport system permease protein